MYTFTFSITEFMQEYWQKKPVVIKGAFKNFVDPISPEELAGLALEDVVDSRLVTNLDNNWGVEDGPIPETRFSQLPETHWSLLVQAANHWHPQSADLIKPFSNLPNWLFDDLMVGFSTPHGGVGPHIDQYDVFIIQGMGKRQWRVGAKDEGQYIETTEHGGLRQIEGFAPVIDEVLEAGDLIYIPSGFPHEGESLEASLSYSVGYRSPKEQELVSNFADFYLAHDLGDVHLHNPNQGLQNETGQISVQDSQLLTQMLTKAINDPTFTKKFIGAMLSQSRHQLNILPIEEESEQLHFDEIAFQLEKGAALVKVSGLKTLFHELQPDVLYINGEEFSVSENLVQVLCEQDWFDFEQLDFELEHKDKTAIEQLVNRGYWYLESEE